MNSANSSRPFLGVETSSKRLNKRSPGCSVNARSTASSSALSVPFKDQLSTLTIYIVSWNVGTRYPDNISLRNLLQIQRDDSREYQKYPDIYAIGLQEVNAQPQNQVLNLFKEDPWTNKIKELLKNHDYVCVKTEQMQGLLLTLFFKREHVRHLRDIEAEFTRTGFGGMWGNKGAISIRFNLYGCAITFIVAHLAAHDKQLDERIEDYNQIIANHHYHVTHYREIFDHDYVFWFGDLNFRLQGDDTPGDVYAAIKNAKLADLLLKDQLLAVREKSRKAFHLMKERLPEFPPTFKFKEGTSKYDLKRKPAWTDRILYAVQPLQEESKLVLHAKQISYKSYPNYNISDHKPVTSEFEIQIYKSYLTTSIEFREIGTWIIGEEVTLEYRKPLDFEEKDSDWIGIYPSNYNSLCDYVGYEYVHRSETPPTSEFEDLSSSSIHYHRHHNKTRLRREIQQNFEIVRIDFSQDINLKDGQHYILIYFQNTGLRGVVSLSGMSNAFKAEKKS